MKVIRNFAITLLLITTSAALALAQDEAKYKELPNFHVVNGSIFRGAQPANGGIKKLVDLGVKTIVNLRDDDERAKQEEVEARAAGLRYFNIPLDNFGRPSDEKVDQILALLRESENQPVFVHCKRGADRTGTVIAIYRISFEGWTSEKAKAEAKKYGMGFWQTGMKDYIHDYYERKKRVAVN